MFEQYSQIRLVILRSNVGPAWTVVCRADLLLICSKRILWVSSFFICISRPFLTSVWGQRRQSKKCTKAQLIHEVRDLLSRSLQLEESEARTFRWKEILFNFFCLIHGIMDVESKVRESLSGVETIQIEFYGWIKCAEILFAFWTRSPMDPAREDSKICMAANDMCMKILAMKKFFLLATEKCFLHSFSPRFPELPTLSASLPVARSDRSLVFSRLCILFLFRIPFKFIIYVPLLS